MVDNQILETRKQIEEQRKQLEQARQTQATPKRVAFTPRKERETRRQFVSGVTKSEQQLRQQQQQFEQQVARVAPQQAKAQYLEQFYKEATAKINTRIERSNANISRYQKEINELRDKMSSTSSDSNRKSYKKDIEAYEDRIDTEQQELRGWKEGASGSKASVVQRYFSGQTSNLADYYVRKEEQKGQRSQQLKQAEAQATKLTKQTYEKYGIKPFYDTKGNISGFEDKVAQKSYSFEQLGKIRPEILPELKRAGVISYDEKQVKTITPTIAYKDPFTGKMISAAPGKAPKGYIPTAVSTETGLEMGIVEQIKLRQKYSDAFKEIKAKPTKKEQKVLGLDVTGATTVSKHLFLSPVTGLLTEGGKALQIVKEPLAEGISLAGHYISAPVTGFLGEAKKAYQVVVPEQTRTKINNIIWTDIKLSTKPIKIKDKSGELVSYKSVTGKDLITLREYFELLKEPLVDVQRERFDNAKNYADNLFSNKFSDLIYKQNKVGLDSRKITWDKAVSKSSKTKEWKDLETRHSNAFNRNYKSGTTSATTFAQIATPVLDITPKTWTGLGLTAGTAYGVSKIATPVVATALIASKPITNISNMLYEGIETKTKTGGFVKSSIFSLGITSLAPIVGTAYGLELSKGLVTKPKETVYGLVDFATEKPEELAGFAVGGALLGRGARYGELKARGLAGRAAKTTTHEIPGYGEVKIQNIPKYGEVVWVKGAYSMTEKVAVMKQVNSLLGTKKRMFVQVSAQGTPMTLFSNRKGAGFEVKQIGNPVRGLYEAPHWEFLKKHGLSEAGAASGYSGLGGREGILPSPVGFIETLIGKAKVTRQRPFEYLRRTYGEIKLPEWIASATDSILGKKKIPASSQKVINKYYNEFINEPISFNKYEIKTVLGKKRLKLSDEIIEYTGQAKLKLTNDLNLRSRGSGQALKYYVAMLQYQNKFKLQLPSGAENLSGILPFGAESQLVSGLGTRFFTKSIKDLRKSTTPSFAGKLLEFVTGTKRGEAVAMIDGALVEIQPVRAFPGKTKIKTTKTPAELLSSQLIESSKIKGDFSEGLFGDFSKSLRERRSGVRPVSPTRPIVTLTRSTPEPNVTRRRTIKPVEEFSLFRTEPRRLEQPRGIRNLLFERRPPREPERRPPKRPTKEPTRRLIVDRLREPPMRREPSKSREQPRGIRNLLFERRPPREPTKYTFIPTTRRKKRLIVKSKKKMIKKGRKFTLLPTAFELATGIKKGKPRKRLSEITGFEITRF